ncbi:MAG TPA: DnaB-like helicase C-terminal domain-containing protein [Nocardioidaceae bacterium]|nr:DnaB-like helicase C-terminal domain-containing protein [Nocardioidaceae bacterium]
MTDQPVALTRVLVEADDKLRAGVSAGAAVWSTGFAVLDRHLSGGFRSGELVLLAGPQGLGKTTLALQVLRNVAAAGHAALYLSFEHDAQAMLERLVALEMPQSSEFGELAGTVRDVRAAFDAEDGTARPLAERLAHTTGGLHALEAVRAYSDRLHVHRSSGSSTTLEVIRAVIEKVRAETGTAPMVVVDYLQKIPVPGVGVEDERVTTVVEGLKDLALDLELPVLAIAASDKEGIETGKRMRVQHLRGSSALAYEADIVLIMNDKFDVVARHHLVYDLGNADRFRQWVVITIEKNRSGQDKIDLEFRKRFEQGRFDTGGQQVGEQLVDDRVFVE